MKRCHDRVVGGSRPAGIQLAPPSALSSTALTPPSAQAQPQISKSSPAVTAWFGAGDTMTNFGAIDQTGLVEPVGCPAASRTTSLYQPVVNGPAARVSMSVSRHSHLTLFVPTYDDGKADVKSLTDATTNAGYPSAPKS